MISASHYRTHEIYWLGDGHHTPQNWRVSRLNTSCDLPHKFFDTGGRTQEPTQTLQVITCSFSGCSE